MALQLLQPRIGTSFSSRPSQGDYGFSFDISVPRQPELSALQALRAIQAAKTRDDGESFWDKVRSGGRSVLGKVLHTILRPSWAMAEGTRRALEGEGFDIGDFAKGFSRGIQAKKHTTFSEVLDQEGILGDHGRLRALAGFGLDVVTDPINLALLAAAPVTGGASAGLVAARMAATRTLKVSTRVLDKGVEADLLATRSQLNAVKFNIHQGDELAPVREYADRFNLLVEKRLKGIEPTDADKAHLSIAAREAHEVYRSVVPRAVQLQLRLPFTRGTRVPLTPTSVAGKRVAPLAPSIMRTAAGRGVLGHVPGVARGAAVVGRAFKTTFDDPLAGGKLTTQHVQESLTKKYTDDINRELRPFTGMDADKQFDAIAAYDTPGALTAEGRLNLEALTKANLDNEQRAFVAAWHGIMERFRIRDDDFGLHYKLLKDKRGYVPHLYDADRVSVITRSKTAVPSHTRTRLNENWSIRQIREFKEELRALGGDASRVADDPIELLVIHANRAAKAHAESAYRSVTMRGYGIPARVRDKARWDRVHKRLSALHNKNVHLLDQTLPEYRQSRRFVEKAAVGRRFAAEDREVLRKHQARKAEIDEKIADVEARRQAFNEFKDELAYPVAFNDLVRMSEKDLKEAIEQGHISKEAAKLIRQVRAKARDKSVNKKQLREFWDNFIDRQFEGHRTPFGALIAQQQRARAKIDDRVAEDLAKVASKKEKALAKIDKKLDDEFAQIDKELDRLASRIAVNERRLERAAVAKVNPEVAKNNLVPVDRATMRGANGEPYAFPPRVANSIDRVERILTDDQALQQFDGLWNRWTAMWKTFVTVVNPGYRARNTLSDVWNMYIDGVPGWAIPVYGVKATKLLADAKRGKSKAVRLMEEAYQDGILSGQFTGDIQTVAEIARFGSPYRFLIRGRGKGRKLVIPLRMAHDFNRNAENLGRLTHWLYRRNFERLGRTEAAQRVRSAHFDYEELTRFEQQRMKQVAPFYTWTRKNIPFQIQQIASRPGRVATFPKLVQESEIAAGGGEGDIVPDYLTENFGFKVPFGKGPTYLMPQIGFADLAKIENPAEFAQLMHPALKAVAEVTTGKSIFTGADIVGSHPRNPIADPLGITTNIISKIPGANVGRTQRNIRGQDVGGLGINPWFSYVFGQLPITNEFFVRRSDIKKAQGGLGGKATLLSYLGGLSMSEIDQETAALINQMQFEEEFRKYIRGLRDEDLLPEPEDDGFSDFERSIQDLIRGGGTR